jgi:hypothetical protein
MAFCPHRPSLANQLRGDRWVFRLREQPRQVRDGRLELREPGLIATRLPFGHLFRGDFGYLGSSIWLVLSSAANSGWARSKPKSAALPVSPPVR